MSTSNTNDYIVINGTSSNDTIENSGNNVTIFGSGGNDYIHNLGVDPSNATYWRGRNAVISGDTGNDTIDNSGAYSLIDGGTGSDILDNTSYGINSTINGGTGDDSIQNSANAKIYGGTGDDTITNTDLGANSTLSGETGDDYISTYNADNVSIDGGLGNDLIDLRGNAKGVTVRGNMGNDTIYSNSGATYGIVYQYSLGDGNDIIQGFKSNDTIKIINGTYSIQQKDLDTIIKVGSGQITVKNYTGVVIVDGTLESISNNDKSVNGTSSADSLYNEKAGAVINGFAGNDTISNYGNNVTIDSGTGDDSIHSHGSRALINAGDGNDTVWNCFTTNLSYVSNNNTIYAGSGNDSVYNASLNAYTLIELGSGDDTVSNRANNVTITGGEGNDIVANRANNVTMKGDAGRDFFYSYGANSFIDGGNDNDTLWIYNTASLSAVYGGSGNDQFISVAIKNTLNGGEGNDTIKNNAADVTVNGGTGNDSIYFGEYSTNNLIQYTNGDGNDTILGYNSTTKISIVGGSYSTQLSGSDTIIKVDNGQIIIKDYSDSLNIIGNRQIDTLFSNSADDTLIIGTSNADSIYNTGNRVTINTGDGNDTLYSWITNNSVVDFGSGNDRLDNWGSNYISVNGGSGNDALWSSGAYATILGGEGNDTIVNNMSAYDNGSTIGVGDNAFLDGGEGNDFIWNYLTKKVTINAGTGTDTISLESSTSSNTIYYTNGDGNDIIYGFVSTDTIKIVGGAYSTQKSGSDTIIKVGTGKMTLKNYIGTINIDGTSVIENYNINTTVNGSKSGDTIQNYAGGVKIFASDGDDSIYSSVLEDYKINDSWGQVTIDAGNGNDSISNYDYDVSISAGAGNDSIYTKYHRVTVKGGTGNDTITKDSSYGYNIFQYAEGDGNDIIYGFTSNDSIHITRGGYSTTIKGSDTIITVGNGKITLKGYTGNVKIINSLDIDIENSSKHINNTVAGSIVNGGRYSDTLKNSASDVQMYGGAGRDSIYNRGGTNITLSGGDDSDTINNAFSEYVSIDGGNGNDSIYGNNSYATISGGEGNDTIIGNHWRSKINAGVGDDLVSLTTYWYNTLDGGEGNDRIISGGGELSVNGGAGNDFISLSGGNLTVTGGTGDDTIYGNSASIHSYQYKYGDGNDVIYGYGSNDTVTITGAGHEISTVNNDVVINVSDNSGSITLKDAKGKKINVYSDQNPDPDPTLPSSISQQEVIKKFMKSLDTTNSSGISALNQAVNFATNGYFSNAQAAINQMIIDCQNASSADDFLKNSCGINLNNLDTGAITGYDAGGSTYEKTAESIVPESGSLNNFTNNTFTTNGLTVQLARFDSRANPYNISYSSLSNDTQKYIWKALNTWWVKNSLDLIAQSYGNNYGFDSSSSATVKKISIGFVNENDNTLATTWNWSNKTASQLAITINMKYYNSLSINSVDGQSSATSSYLDRTLAHEFTHAVMAANVNYYNNLPQFIKEGMAELTHGIDDERNYPISYLVQNSSMLKNSLNLMNTGTGEGDAYAGGYMFLRYLAKQGSEHSNSASSSGNISASKSVSGENSGSSNVTVNGAVLTISKDYADDIIDLANYASTVTKIDTTKLIKGIMIIGNEIANSIRSGNGDNTISGNTGNDTIFGGKGNDILYGEAGNDNINGDAGNDTLCGGSGKDILTGGTGNDIFVHIADNDIITDYTVGEDKIKLAEGDLTTYSASGSNLILNVGLGTITVKGGAKKAITIIEKYGKETTINGKIDSTNTTLTVTNSTKSPVTVDNAIKTINASTRTTAVKIKGNSLANSIIGGSGNDSLNGGAGVDTLNGGKGNDTLTGGNGNDIFFYQNGQGSDVITDYVVGQDKIKITGAKISKTSVSGSDVILTVGSGSIKVKNAKGKKLSIYNNASSITSTVIGSSSTSNGGSSNTLTITNSTKSPVTIGSAIKTINASSRTTAIKIIGNSLVNSIKGGKGADTLIGGKGNDTLTGGNGNDVFVYTTGDGNDVITDYTAKQDKIKLTSGSISSSSIKGSDVILKVGTGSITLKNAKGKSITVVDSTGKSTSKVYGTSSKNYVEEHWFTEDDNFVTSEMDSILDNKNYNVMSNNDYNVISEVVNINKENVNNSLVYSKKQLK